MQVDVRFESPAATVALADESVGAGARSGDVSEADALRKAAESGGAFLVEGDDPWVGDLRVYVDEPVPKEVEEVCSARSGSFLLRVPSGRLWVGALGSGSPESGERAEPRTLEVPPGDYAVSLADGTLKEIPALVAQQQAIVDPADWRLHERVDRLGAFGCLSVALGFGFVAVPYTRRAYWFLVPLFFLPTCAYSLLRRLPAYARVEARREEHERDLPQIAVAMRRVESTEGLEGGGYRAG